MIDFEIENEKKETEKRGRGRPPKTIDDVKTSKLVCLKNFIHSGVKKLQGDDISKLSSGDIQHLKEQGLVGTDEQLEELRLMKKFGVNEKKVYPVNVKLD